MSDRREGGRQVNHYGTRAQARWRAYQPEDYLRIPEHERASFFARLGEDIEAAIGRRTQELADQEEPADVIGFQVRYALLSALRLAAEQDVLAQMLPAPHDSDDDPAGTTPPGQRGREDAR
jgi:hypothetical protein